MGFRRFRGLFFLGEKKVLRDVCYKIYMGFCLKLIDITLLRCVLNTTMPFFILTKLSEIFSKLIKMLLHTRTCIKDSIDPNMFQDELQQAVAGGFRKAIFQIITQYIITSPLTVTLLRAFRNLLVSYMNTLNSKYFWILWITTEFLFCFVFFFCFCFFFI